MVVNGVELLKMIKDGKIKDNTIIKNNWSGQYWVYIRDILYWSDEKGNIKSSGINWYKDKSKTSVVSTYHLVNTEVIEIIEDKEIDIQAIRKLELIEECVRNPGESIGHIEYRAKEPRLIALTTNEIIEAIKQLDKKIK